MPETTGPAQTEGVPIYWLNGNKVADDYEDFYDGNLGQRSPIVMTETS